jgi:hypothetical protein
MSIKHRNSSRFKGSSPIINNKSRNNEPYSVPGFYLAAYAAYNFSYSDLSGIHPGINGAGERN